MIDKYALIQRSVFQLDVVPLFPIYAAVMNFPSKMDNRTAGVKKSNSAQT